MSRSLTEIVLEDWANLEQLLQEKATSKILLTGRSLNIPQVVAVARHHAAIDVSSEAYELMKRSLGILQQRVESGQVIYGVNTGFGGTADVRTKNLVQLQRALIRELHYGVLPPGERDHAKAPLSEMVASCQHDIELDTGSDMISYLPWSWARATILVRINSLITGCSAVRPIIVEKMVNLLEHDIIPMIPLRGSISASGDLSPLSYICGAIQGKSTIRVLARGGRHVYADAALAHVGVDTVTLEMKEGLAMTNGTSVSAAAAALALHDTQNLAIMAQILTAMSVEALVGTTESFYPFFSRARPHPGQIESAQNILSFLSGSRLTKVNDGADSALRQDRYSLRTAPQWLGPILEDLVLSHQQIAIECNSVTDNPLISPEGEFLHGGNFQAKSVTSAMEKARQGIQGIGRMLFSQCTEMINPATNKGLTPNLLAEDPSVSLIFKGTDLNIASLTAELGFLANPVNHVQTAEMGNQSLNSLALISTRYTHTANDVLSQLAAAHLIAVCQALDLRAMHVQFLHAFRLEFSNMVDIHCGHAQSSKQEVENIQHDAQLLDVTSELSQPPSTKTVSTGTNLYTDTVVPQLNGQSTRRHDSELPDLLANRLWTELLKAFEETTSLDASTRFVVIGRSLRTVLLDDPGFLNSSTNPILQATTFADSIALLLRDRWCAHRDAYLIHGDATPVLGHASKIIYGFVRRDLKVPLLHTKELMTPRYDVEGGASLAAKAPTVGSFLGTVYRALKDGTLVKVAVDVLRTVNESSK